MSATEELVKLPVLKYHLFRSRHKSFHYNLENAIDLRCKICTGFQDELFIKEKNGTSK